MLEDNESMREAVNDKPRKRKQGAATTAYWRENGASRGGGSDRG
jgi:hypothetical protein